jgi:spore maturation protein CgeB
MKIAFYGSSLVSSYWNGAATYYRGILHALARRGYDITFYEPDAFDRQKHRDIEAPDWARSVVFPATIEAARAVLAEAAGADIVVKANGVGIFDRELLEGVLDQAAPHALKIFWDVDAAATLDEMRGDPGHPVLGALDELDLVLTYGGGPPVIDALSGLRGQGVRAGVQCARPVDAPSGAARSSLRLRSCLSRQSPARP